jgi:hypothetical protein
MKFVYPLFFLISMTMVQDKDERLEKLSWITDQWVWVDNESVTYENWIKNNDGSYSGESFTVKNGDTVFSEQLKIEKSGDDIFYTAVVKHNPGPVSFKLIELGDNKAVFENPEHDFPNKILYVLKNSDSLYARIEGKNKNGKYAVGEYYYTRAK